MNSPHPFGPYLLLEPLGQGGMAIYHLRPKIGLSSMVSNTPGVVPSGLMIRQCAKGCSMVYGSTSQLERVAKDLVNGVATMRGCGRDFG